MPAHGSTALERHRWWPRQAARHSSGNGTARACSGEARPRGKPTCSQARASETRSQHAREAQLRDAIAATDAQHASPPASCARWAAMASCTSDGSASMCSVGSLEHLKPPSATRCRAVRERFNVIVAELHPERNHGVQLYSRQILPRSYFPTIDRQTDRLLRVALNRLGRSALLTYVPTYLLLRFHSTTPLLIGTPVPKWPLAAPVRPPG